MYFQALVPLVNTLRQLANPRTEILLAQELRDSDVQKNNWQNFLALAKEYFKIENIPLTEQNRDYCSPDIILLRLRLNKS